jgi:phosphoribosyl 1,2-cyclic phosphate phosphodiesterase
MKITILGCGNSLGVPVIGCDCSVCTSENPKNKRLRVSVAVEVDSLSLIIDTSPDFRQQILREKIKKIDAVLYTHDHADHVHGIDDLRAFNFGNDTPIPIYSNGETIGSIKKRFSYAFDQKPKKNIKNTIFCPNLQGFAVEIEEDDISWFDINDTRITIFEQKHGKIKTIGYRIGNFAYSTDVNELSEVAFETLAGVDCWVVDCLRYEPSYSHSYLERTLEWIKRVQPKTTILTHLAHEFDYEKLSAELPAGVFAGYDGMVVEI